MTKSPFDYRDVGEEIDVSRLPPDLRNAVEIAKADMIAAQMRPKAPGQEVPFADAEPDRRGPHLYAAGEGYAPETVDRVNRMLGPLNSAIGGVADAGAGLYRNANAASGVADHLLGGIPMTAAGLVNGAIPFQPLGGVAEARAASRDGLLDFKRMYPGVGKGLLELADTPFPSNAIRGGGARLASTADAAREGSGAIVARGAGVLDGFKDAIGLRGPRAREHEYKMRMGDEWRDQRRDAERAQRGVDGQAYQGSQEARDATRWRDDISAKAEIGDLDRSEKSWRAFADKLRAHSDDRQRHMSETREAFSDESRARKLQERAAFERQMGSPPAGWNRHPNAVLEERLSDAGSRSRMEQDPVHAITEMAQQAGVSVDRMARQMSMRGFDMSWFRTHHAQEGAKPGGRMTAEGAEVMRSLRGDPKLMRQNPRREQSLREEVSRERQRFADENPRLPHHSQSQDREGGTGQFKKPE